MFHAERVDHVAFTARDIDTLAAWYEHALGMQRRHADDWADVAGGHPLLLCNGDACVALFMARDDALPRPVDPRDPNEHIALVLDRSNYEQAKRDLEALSIRFEEWDHGICDSIYVVDPEGHQVELVCYHAGV